MDAEKIDAAASLCSIISVIIFLMMMVIGYYSIVLRPDNDVDDGRLKPTRNDNVR